jgi:hypothetical protein
MVTIGCGGDTELPTAPSAVNIPRQTATAAHGTMATNAVASTAASAADVLATISFKPNVVIGGEMVEGTITLMNAAPAGGTEVRLESSRSQISVDRTVMVAAGAMSATFRVATRDVTSTEEGAVVAFIGDTMQTTERQSGRLRLLPRPPSQ